MKPLPNARRLPVSQPSPAGRAAPASERLGYEPPRAPRPQYKDDPAEGSAIRVAAALRQRAVPFVLVTGYGRVQLSEPELQDVPHLPKPVNYHELVQTIASAVHAGRRH